MNFKLFFKNNRGKKKLNSLNSRLALEVKEIPRALRKTKINTKQLNILNKSNKNKTINKEQKDMIKKYVNKRLEI